MRAFAPRSGSFLDCAADKKQGINQAVEQSMQTFRQPAMKCTSWRQRRKPGTIPPNSVEMGENVLRDHDKHLLQEFLSEQIGQFRAAHHYTQEQMAERLRVSPRSYIDLEHNKFGCSALTLISFLLLLDGEQVLSLLAAVRRLLKKGDQHDAA